MKKIVKQVPILILLLAALTYSLGAGISHYLGAAIYLPSFLLGMIAIITLITASSLLQEYFRLPLLPLLPGETPHQRVVLRTQLLQVSYAVLTILGAIVISMLVSGMFSIQTGIILILISFLFLLILPPFRLSEAGFGEIIIAIVLALLSPGFAFLLQEDEIHRILPMMTFPLFFIATAWLLAENFHRYSSDQKLGRRSLLIGLTWQRAVPIHHVLILVAYLFFAVSPLFGFSWRLLWPVFISLPFAILQIIWLQRIANGGRPIWRFFNALIRSVFGLTIYLLALSFWLR